MEVQELPSILKTTFSRIWAHILILWRTQRQLYVWSWSFHFIICWGIPWSCLFRHVETYMYIFVLCQWMYISLWIFSRTSFWLQLKHLNKLMRITSMKRKTSKKMLVQPRQLLYYWVTGCLLQMLAILEWLPVWLDQVAVFSAKAGTC